MESITKEKCLENNLNKINIFKEKLIPILLKFFQKIKENAPLSSNFVRPVLP